MFLDELSLETLAQELEFAEQFRKKAFMQIQQAATSHRTELNNPKETKRNLDIALSNWLRALDRAREIRTHFTKSI